MFFHFLCKGGTGCLVSMVEVNGGLGHGLEVLEVVFYRRYLCMHVVVVGIGRRIEDVWKRWSSSFKFGMGMMGRVGWTKGGLRGGCLGMCDERVLLRVVTVTVTAVGGRWRIYECGLWGGWRRRWRWVGRDGIVGMVVVDVVIEVTVGWRWRKSSRREVDHPWRSRVPPLAQIGNIHLLILIFKHRCFGLKPIPQFIWGIHLPLSLALTHARNNPLASMVQWSGDTTRNAQPRSSPNVAGRQGCNGWSSFQFAVCYERNKMNEEKIEPVFGLFFIFRPFSPIYLHQSHRQTNEMQFALEHFGPTVKIN